MLMDFTKTRRRARGLPYAKGRLGQSGRATVALAHKRALAPRHSCGRFRRFDVRALSSATRLLMRFASTQPAALPQRHAVNFALPPIEAPHGRQSAWAKATTIAAAGEGGHLGAGERGPSRRRRRIGSAAVVDALSGHRSGDFAGACTISKTRPRRGRCGPQLHKSGSPWLHNANESVSSDFSGAQRETSVQF